MTARAGSLCGAPTGKLTNREIKSGPRAGLRFHPDAPAVALDDLLADRQADAGAGVLAAAVQALEHLEQPPGLARVNADAVIPHGELPVPVHPPRGNVDAGGRLPAKLERVGDEVLQDLFEPRGLPRDRRQGVVCDGRLLFGDDGL